MTSMTYRNKQIMWDYWQRLTVATSDTIADIVKNYVHEDITWNCSHPLNTLQGVNALIEGFWQPFMHAFQRIEKNPYIFLAGVSKGQDWVTGTGYITGTFTHDWLGIPATGRKTHIRFGEHSRVQDGKIIETLLILDMVDFIRQAGYYILPPSYGAEGGLVPEPSTCDGILLTDQDELEARKSLQLVDEMAYGLGRYDQKTLASMGQKYYWHPQMRWYGPAGIGMCFSLEEFEDFHQIPFLTAFPDRPLPGGQHLRVDRFAEGNYVGGGGWGALRGTHLGEYLGCPPTGNMIKMRVMDWWRCEDNFIVENWVLIDLIDIFMQFGVDLLADLREQL